MKYLIDLYGQNTAESKDNKIATTLETKNKYCIKHSNDKSTKVEFDSKLEITKNICHTPSCANNELIMLHKMYLYNQNLFNHNSTDLFPSTGTSKTSK